MKISIITPVLNGEKYIASCLESVLWQNYQDVEHIIVDGLSSDNTLSIVTRYQSQHPGRIVVHSAKDNGVGDAWNWGITHARGDVLGWLGQDDRLYPGALEKVNAFFTPHWEAFFLYGEAEVIDEQGNFLTMYRTEAFDYKRLLNRHCYIVPTSAFYRKEVFNTCGLFSSFGSDYECWLRIGKRYHLYYLKGEILSQFRLHDDAASSKNALETIKETYLASRKHGGRLFNTWWRLYYISRFTRQIRRVSDPLKPILGFSYPFLNRIISGSIRSVCFYSPIFTRKEYEDTFCHK